MATIRITLKSDLCAGSGEATGVAVDKDLCISQAGLPYIPARRIKGCLRGAAKLLQAYGCPEAADPNIDALFGTGFGEEGCLDLRDAVLPGADVMERWLRSSVPMQLRQAAAPLNVARLFTYVRGQTKLKNGVAETGTLRYTRVLDHYSTLDQDQETFLEAKVSLQPGHGEADLTQLADLLEQSCRALRHLGSMRNRGLGDIRTELLDKDTLLPEPPMRTPARTVQAEGEPDTVVRYQVALNASVTLPGCTEDLLEIPARSVIGCVANTYLRSGRAEDPLFRQLFLDGTVRWSALTPSVGGQRSVPTPLMLVRLKNEKKYHNLYTSGSAQGKKQKTLDGTYTVQDEKGFRVASVRTRSVYHHSTGKDGTLYMQSSLDAGMICGGEVRLPAALADPVKALLRETAFAFGRSRGAQYAVCSLSGEPDEAPIRSDWRETTPGAPIYAVLQSDLLLSENGRFSIDSEHVGSVLAKELDLDRKQDEERMDYCRYHTIGGYQASWQLQKPQLPAVRGGSVYVFRAKGGRVPTWVTLGELPQEGFGLVRIYTEAEMQALSQIQSSKVDTRELNPDEAELCKRLQTALLTAAAREAIRDSVIRLYQYDRVTKDLKKGTIGRLRLMLSEAETYEDLYRSVQTIKESDVHSENKTSAKKRVNDLLTLLYGPTPPSFNALLQKTDSGRKLAEMIRRDPSAEERLRKRWKEPLDLLLHLARYEKAKGDR